MAEVFISQKDVPSCNTLRGSVGSSRVHESKPDWTDPRRLKPTLTSEGFCTAFAHDVLTTSRTETFQGPVRAHWRLSHNPFSILPSRRVVVWKAPSGVASSWLPMSSAGLQSYYPTKTGLQARKCGARKINTASDLVGALAVCEVQRAEILEFVNILKSPQLRQTAWRCSPETSASRSSKLFL